MAPDRVVIGDDNNWAGDAVDELYADVQTHEATLCVEADTAPARRTGAHNHDPRISGVRGSWQERRC